MNITIRKIKLWGFFLGLILSLLISTVLAVQVELDLLGKGKLEKVNLPFEYYKRQQGDKFTLISQGGYKIYDLVKDQNKVAVIGDLHPCLGIAVTDGKKMIVFHKHSTNLFTSDAKGSPKNLICENLNLEDKDSLRARIYTTEDSILWEKFNFSASHNNKSLDGVIEEVINVLVEVGILKKYIFNSTFCLYNSSNFKANDNYNTKYDLCEEYVAVSINDAFTTEDTLETLVGSKDKRQIKFAAIDPITENILSLPDNTKIKREDYY